MSRFAMAFNIGKTNEERMEAFSIYQKAFGAKKTSEAVAPGGDVHIIMDIDGVNILLAPGGKVEKITENSMCCKFNYDSEDELREAYDVLTVECLSCSLEGPYPWATLLGLVVDKYGVCWALYYNE